MGKASGEGFLADGLTTEGTEEHRVDQDADPIVEARQEWSARRDKCEAGARVIETSKKKISRL